ncbi:hypothetical protein [Salinimonas chungwhensis]|uniref:hypothetical protein n=1 Tax=Salinimonas chungwhensis TaxID=265425 RepID=UPI00037A72CC|nr:hypothetical protein [Salinimonas chungwhensis]
MKISQLNHKKTPDALRAINTKLAALLADPTNDNFVRQLQLLIEARDTFIKGHIKELSADEAVSFATKELEINAQLVSAIAPFKSEAQTDLQQLAQSKKAIKQYK